MIKLKNILLFIILICAFRFVSIASAQTISPKPTAVSPAASQALNEKLNTQINQLKDKIASRVTELNLVEKRGIIGVVSEVSTNKITLKDIEDNTRQIDVDEITKFASASAKSSFGLSDLTKGSRISVFGLYNKQTKRILARFIRTSVDPVFLTGGISEIDSKNITINLLSGDNKTTKIDIQPTTKISSYDTTGDLKKIIFSGLSVGDRIFIIGFPDKTDKSLIIANRVVGFDDLPKDPKINIEQPSPTPIPTVVQRSRTLPVTSSPTRKPTPAITR